MLRPRPIVLNAAARDAFTLVEMLAVMAVMLILLGLIVPVITSLKSASDINRAAYDIADTLEQARAYAMSHNTYVYVGIEEVDSSHINSGQQKPVADGEVGGRVGIAIIAAKDGTRGYDVNAPLTWSTNYPTIAANSFNVGKLRHYENLHLVDLGTPPTTGGMARTALGSDSTAQFYNVGTAPCASMTPFDYPLGNPLTKGWYSFVKVIQFDPQGVPRIQSQANSDAVTNCLEIGLQQTQGTTAPALPSPATSGAIAAIQLDGLSGSVRVYRP